MKDSVCSCDIFESYVNTSKIDEAKVTNGRDGPCAIVILEIVKSTVWEIIQDFNLSGMVLLCESFDEMAADEASTSSDDEAWMFCVWMEETIFVVIVDTIIAIMKKTLAC